MKNRDNSQQVKKRALRRMKISFMAMPFCFLLIILLAIIDGLLLNDEKSFVTPVLGLVLFYILTVLPLVHDSASDTYNELEEHRKREGSLVQHENSK